MSFAFVFPGQGSQYVGMGKDLYQHYQKVRSLYDRAEEILEFPLKKISFEGPEDQLKQTRFTQPAVFVHSVAVTALLQDRNLRPQAVAGHSLGEYSALTAAGALSFDEGLQLVKLRGNLMQQSGEKHPGTMAAIMGLDDQTIINLCQKASEKGHVNPANFNSPRQIVISGTEEGVHQAMQLAREKKARRVTELMVSGAFHSPLMKDALAGLTEALSLAHIRSPEIPVYPNVTAKPVREADKIRDLLQQQLLSPVLWQKIIENMITDGIDKFYEVGPSKILSGLNKRVRRDVPNLPVGTLPDLESLTEEI